MSATAATDAHTAEIPYTLDDGAKLVNETYGPNNIRRHRTGTPDPRRVAIRNGREHARELSLDGSGFVLVDHHTAVRDFFDGNELETIYYPEVEQLIRKVSGAARVVIFDHTLRSGDEAEREAKLVREPVLSAHNDYTEWSGPQRVRDLLPEEADALLAHRFAIIQVWRAIDRPVQSNPLAVADARSVAPADLMVTERRYPGRVGQTYRLRYNPAHRWFYFPDMRRDEALVFKVFDSARDGRARFTPHSAIEDPRRPVGAAPRQSIETRALAFFAN